MGGLPTPRTVNGFAAGSKDPKIMFVVMRDGVFRSTDAGTSWKHVESKLRNPVALALHPRKTEEAYLATAEGDIYVSADGGIKWKKQNQRR